MSLSNVKSSTDQKMQKSLESLKTALSKIRTGRAHAGLLDHVQVDYYGSMVPINQVANVAVTDARTLSVQAWEKKMVMVIDKAMRCRSSPIGISPRSTS